ncbi:rhodanese-like domain-containing protein [Haloferula sargassicola]|uniref:Rhodanese domain-containing protein n=1 Tax=Haloferula sargassicola TaxID=490096 RepID=A0ABP9UT24_9BACT
MNKSGPIAAACTLLLAGCLPPPPPVPKTTPIPYPSRDTRKVSHPAPRAGRLSVIDLSSFFELQQTGSLLVYDVRPGFVQAFGTIPGAISWPKGHYDAALATHRAEIRAAEKAGKRVVFYCTDADCPDARAVASRVAALGHDVSILEGGYADWKASGLGD